MSNRSAMLCGACIIAIVIFTIACAVFAPRMTPADKEALKQLDDHSIEFAEACYFEWQMENNPSYADLAEPYRDESNPIPSPVEEELTIRDQLRAKITWNGQDTDQACKRSWMRWWDDSLNLVCRPWYCSNY